MNEHILTLNKIFFVVLILLTVIAVFNYITSYILSKKNKQNNNVSFGGDKYEISAKTYNIILITIIVLGVAIRIWKFGLVPGGFNQDGAMAAVDSKALADYGTDRFGTWLPAHLYAWGYGQMSSLLSYLMIPFVKIFGLNPISARMPQLLASLMGGTFFFLFIKDMFGKKAGLIAASFVAFNPWHFVQSRWALDCNLLPHFFMGGLFFFQKGLMSKKKYIYISMVFFGLCMYCYGITIYTIPAFLVAVAIYYLIKKSIDFKTILISFAIYMFISWPFLLTMAVNYFKWETINLPFVTIQYFPDSIRSNDILFFSENFAKQFLDNLHSLLNTTVLQKQDLPWNNIYGFGTTFLCSLPLMVAGFVGLALRKAKGIKSLVVFAILTGVWVGLVTNNVNVNRINIIYYPVMMLIVIGIYFIITELKNSVWIVSIIYASLTVFLVFTYFTTYADTIKTYFYDGFGEALLQAEDSGAEKIYVTADAQSKGYWGTSEILTLFYDKTDAQYFQGKTNISNGHEYLSYKDRFAYCSFSPEIVNETKNEDIAYVIMQADKQLFDTNEYELFDYGNFCSAIKKR